MERRADTMQEVFKKNKHEVSLSVIFRAAVSDCLHLRYSGSAIFDSMLYYP